MIKFLRPIQKEKVAPEKVKSTFTKARFLSLIGVFIGYATFYIVRDNISLSSPNLESSLHIGKTEIGLLTSCLLISYGISKGFMSNLSDKADPKRFMALGLFLCAILSALLYFFSQSFILLCIVVVLLGVFQGMGVGPSFITISNWFEKKNRGFITAIWNSSHNVGGGLISPLVAIGLVLVGSSNWRLAYYVFPAIIAVIISFCLLFLIKGRPEHEGLPPLKDREEIVDSTELTSREIMTKYVLNNRGAWYISFVDTFVYMIRFGIITWLPIFLLETKGFSKEQMLIAFCVFEWAAIPSTLFAGILSDKFFKGYRMPPAIISLILITFCLVGYWNSNNVGLVTFFAAAAGCLIYVPQFLASVHTMEVVPSFAIGSATGLRGFMSYIFGSTLGTTLLGILVDRFGWEIGLWALLIAILICIVFCCLSHNYVKKSKRK